MKLLVVEAFEFCYLFSAAESPMHVQFVTVCGVSAVSSDHEPGQALVDGG